MSDLRFLFAIIFESPGVSSLAPFIPFVESESLRGLYASSVMPGSVN